jgi:ABC-type bacteriocin/lantibiotic exporter with double-glycine peptidase domain
VIHFYTQKNHTTFPGFFNFSFIDRYPLLPVIIFCVAFAVKNGAAFLVYKTQYRFVYAVATRLSENNLLQYLEGDFDQYVQIDSSVHLRKITYQPIEFGHYVLAGFQQVVGQSILILFTVIAILIYNPVLFLLLFVILAIPVIVIIMLLKRKLAGTRKMAKPLSERSLQHLKEALSGYVESNIYDRNNFFTDRYSYYQAQFNNFQANQIALQNTPSRLIEVFAIFGLFVLILINMFTNGQQVITAITIGAFMAAAYKIIPGMVKILNNLAQMKTYRFSIEGLKPGDSVTKNTDQQVNTQLNKIKFSDVSFTFKQQPVVSNLSFDIAPGDFIGLSGLSGKGKTTVVNLLLGFIENDSGKILINDKVTIAADRRGYWKNISYVKQQPFLIHESIIKNITLSDTGFDEQRLQEVIEATGLNLLVSQYPEGLNKILSENGKDISGGQRQRIVIARALYKNADLIILDEPFNELDRASENKLLEHCKKLATAGKMIIMITHDKESLLYCDKIISLDEK